MTKENLIFTEKNYYDFSNGVPISDFEIQKWINECVKIIKEKIKEFPDQEHHFSTISSGNTKVIVECYKQRSNGKYTICSNVCQGYKHKSICDFEF